MFRDRITGQTVETAPDFIQQTSGRQPCQDDPGHFDGVQITGAQQTFLTGQVKEALGMSVGEHDGSMFHLFFKRNILTKKRNFSGRGN
jgi:hypothetical protein